MSDQSLADRIDLNRLLADIDFEGLSEGTRWESLFDADGETGSDGDGIGATVGARLGGFLGGLLGSVLGRVVGTSLLKQFLDLGGDDDE